MARDSQRHLLRGRLSDRVESISNPGNANSNNSSLKSSFGGGGTAVSSQKRESHSSEEDLKELKMQVMEFRERNRELSGITMEADQVDLSLSQLFREQAALEHDRLPREVFIDQQPQRESEKNPREIHLSPRKPGAQQVDRNGSIGNPRSHLSDVCFQRQQQRKQQQRVLEREAQASATPYVYDADQPSPLSHRPGAAQRPPEDTPEYRAFLLREMQRLGMQPSLPEPITRHSEHTTDSRSAAARPYYSPYSSHHVAASSPRHPPPARAHDFWDEQPRYGGSSRDWAPEPHPYSSNRHPWQGGQQYEEPWANSDRNHRMVVAHPAEEERKPPPQKTIEIAPGITRSLRGAEETTIAIEAGWFVVVDCLACEANLQCIADCELVLCSACRTISPNHESAEGLERHGVGLGLNVTGRKREIMTQQCS